MFPLNSMIYDFMVKTYGRSSVVGFFRLSPANYTPSSEK